MQISSRSPADLFEIWALLGASSVHRAEHGSVAGSGGQHTRERQSCRKGYGDVRMDVRWPRSAAGSCTRQGSQDARPRTTWIFAAREAHSVGTAFRAPTVVPTAHIGGRELDRGAACRRCFRCAHGAASVVQMVAIGRNERVVREPGAGEWSAARYARGAKAGC